MLKKLNQSTSSSVREAAASGPPTDPKHGPKFIAAVLAADQFVALLKELTLPPFPGHVPMVGPTLFTFLESELWDGPEPTFRSRLAHALVMNTHTRFTSSDDNGPRIVTEITVWKTLRDKPIEVSVFFSCMNGLITGMAKTPEDAM
jgi:hypothetical protein